MIILFYKIGRLTYGLFFQKLPYMNYLFSRYGFLKYNVAKATIMCGSNY